MTASVLRGLSPAPFVFGALGDPPAAPADEPDDPALEEAFEAGRQEALAESADRIAALEAELAQLAEARDAADQEAHAQAESVRQSAERLGALWAQGVRELEPMLAALAVEAAEAVLEAPLSEAQRSAAGRALSTAIDTVAGGPAVTVSLHPIDLLRVQESGLAGALDETHADLRWEADAELAEGDWAVSTDEAAVRRVRSAMIAALRERLGLPETTRPEPA